MTGPPVRSAAAPAPGPGEEPTPDAFWLAKVDSPHDKPANMTVVVVPPAVGPDPDGALRATLEALDYWTWAIRDDEAAHPSLRWVSYDVKVLGRDAGPQDLRDARIVVTMDGAREPVNKTTWLGTGLPVGPATNPQERRAQRCLVTDSGVAWGPAGEEGDLLRNFVLHEFGHCLGVGHTGESAGLPHCDANGTCYESHPTDVMSLTFADHRQCLSNLDLQSLAVAYGWLTGPDATWKLPPEETYMRKGDYRDVCMPEEMKKY